MVHYQESEEAVWVPGHCSTPTSQDSSSTGSTLTYAEDRQRSSVLPTRTSNRAPPSPSRASNSTLPLPNASPATNQPSNTNTFPGGFQYQTEQRQSSPLRSVPTAITSTQTSAPSALTTPTIESRGNQMSTNSAYVNTYSRKYTPPIHHPMVASGHRPGSAIGLVVAGQKPPTFTMPKGTQITGLASSSAKPKALSYPSPINKDDLLDPSGLYSKSLSVLKIPSNQSGSTSSTKSPDSEMGGSEIGGVKPVPNHSQSAVVPSKSIKPMSMPPIVGYRMMCGIKIPIYEGGIGDPNRQVTPTKSVDPIVTSSTLPEAMSLDDPVVTPVQPAAVSAVAPKSSSISSPEQLNQNPKSSSPLQSVFSQTSSSTSAPRTLFEVPQIYTQSFACPAAPVISITHDSDAGDLPEAPERVPESAASQPNVTEPTQNNDEGDLPDFPLGLAEQVALIINTTFNKDEGELPNADCSSPALNNGVEQPSEVVLECSPTIENNGSNNALESPVAEEVAEIDCSSCIENIKEEPVAPQSSPLAENIEPERAPEFTIVENNNDAVKPQCPAPMLNNVAEEESSLETPEPEPQPESTLSPPNNENEVDTAESQCSIPPKNNVVETPATTQAPESESTIPPLNIVKDVQSHCSASSEKIVNEQPKLPKIKSSRTINPPTVKRRGETESEALERCRKLINLVQGHNTKLLDIEKDHAALSALAVLRGENIRNYLEDPVAAFVGMSEQIDLFLSEKIKLQEENDQLSEEIFSERKKKQSVAEQAKRKLADLEARQQETLDRLRKEAKEQRKTEEALAAKLTAANHEIGQLKAAKKFADTMAEWEIDDLKRKLERVEVEKTSLKTKMDANLDEAKRHIAELETTPAAHGPVLFPNGWNNEPKLAVSPSNPEGVIFGDSRIMRSAEKDDLNSLFLNCRKYDDNLNFDIAKPISLPFNPKIAENTFNTHWEVYGNLPIFQVEPEPSGDSGTSPWLWTAIIALVLALIAAFFFANCLNVQQSTYHMARDPLLEISASSFRPQPSPSPFSAFPGGTDQLPRVADLLENIPPVTKAVGIRVFDLFSLLAFIFWWIS